MMTTAFITAIIFIIFIKLASSTIIDGHPLENSCANFPRCPCNHLQCFELQVPPYCECECPFEILLREERNDRFICGYGNPGQIYDSSSCACDCPSDSKPEDGCPDWYIFNERTCQCLPMFIKIPTPAPTSPEISMQQTDDLVVKETITTTTAEPISITDPITTIQTITTDPITTITTDPIEEDSCPQIGEYCTSAISRRDRCCDGQKGGSTRCGYNDTDIDGNKIGTCCVRNDKYGCSKHSDCCNKHRICYDGQCLHRNQISGICPEIGDECTSAISRSVRCCDGGKDGSTRCLYTDMDIDGNKMGKCCVRNSKYGCENDDDCCDINRICYNGYCLRRNEIPWEVQECPIPGDECSSAVSIEDRCCDGGKSMKCKYNDIEDEENHIGICCIKNGKYGCSMDNDCCSTNRVCHDGYCLRTKDILPDDDQTVAVNRHFDAMHFKKSSSQYIYNLYNNGYLYIIIFIITIWISSIVYGLIYYVRNRVKTKPEYIYRSD